MKTSHYARMIESNANYIARINRRDARIALAVMVVLVALTLAGWAHTWFVTRPAMEALGERQDAEMERLDDLLAEASEMMEEAQR